MQTTPFAKFGDITQTVRGAFAALTEWMNIWVYLQVEGRRSITILAHFWSLSLEEQFYLLWPTLVVVLRSRSSLSMVANSVLLLYSVMNREDFKHLAWWFRINGLCWGVLIFLLRDHWRKFNPPHALAIAIMFAGILALLASTAILGASPLASSMTTLGAAVCVVIAAMNRNTLQLGGFTTAVLNYLGARSYTIYLWHLLIFALIQLAWISALPDLANS